MHFFSFAPKIALLPKKIATEICSIASMKNPEPFKNMSSIYSSQSLIAYYKL
uniref:Uncharacterized protein n=1 Tax=Arundo donax TaxID=35708 RepID=A0A0A9HET1_ARUDO